MGLCAAPDYLPHGRARPPRPVPFSRCRPTSPKAVVTGRRLRLQETSGPPQRPAHRHPDLPPSTPRRPSPLRSGLAGSARRSNDGSRGVRHRFPAGAVARIRLPDRRQRPSGTGLGNPDHPRREGVRQQPNRGSPTASNSRSRKLCACTPASTPRARSPPHRGTSSRRISPGPSLAQAPGKSTEFIEQQDHRPATHLTVVIHLRRPFLRPRHHHLEALKTSRARHQPGLHGRSSAPPSFESKRPTAPREARISSSKGSSIASRGRPFPAKRSAPGPHQVAPRS